jgi:carbon storage regulator CsrA
MEEVMLVLTRKVGEKLIINDNITVTIVEVKGNRIRIAIDAPKDVPILRGELAQWLDLPGTTTAAAQGHSQELVARR